ncbi:unnamed protein product, partial [Phaeothamnion confervicola]
GGAFYDLGSGTGKPVVAAAICHAFSKAVGIEILEGLHHASVEVVRSWDVVGRPGTPQDRRTDIRFVHGDATDPAAADWSDGDVVFANSTCFDDALMNRIAERAAMLRRGAFVITLSRRLPGDGFAVLESRALTMSWGAATVFIHQKLV